MAVRAASRFVTLLDVLSSANAPSREGPCGRPREPFHPIRMGRPLDARFPLASLGGPARLPPGTARRPRQVYLSRTTSPPGRGQTVEMKYYDEDRMSDVREVLEGEVLKWPDVTSKGMMGCLVYFRGRSFFAFLVTNGLVVTKLPARDRRELAGKVDSKAFEMAGRTSSNWIRVPAREPKDLEPVLPYVRKSYEAIMG